MAVAGTVVRGHIQGGLIVPDEPIDLPEGARVQILLPAVPPELQEEFDAWEAASDESWAMTDGWEAADTRKAQP